MRKREVVEITYSGPIFEVQLLAQPVSFDLGPEEPDGDWCRKLGCNTKDNDKELQEETIKNIPIVSWLGVLLTKMNFLKEDATDV